MFQKIIGIIFSLVTIGIIYLSYYVGRLMVMKDSKAVDDVITNEKKGKQTSNLIYLIILIPLLIFVIFHFVFNLG